MSFAEARAAYVAGPMKPHSSWNLRKPTGQMRAIHSSSLGKERQRGKGSEMRLRRGQGKREAGSMLGSLLTPPHSTSGLLRPARITWAGPGLITH